MRGKKHGEIIAALIISCLLCGCQEKDRIETETEIELSGKTERESVRGMTETENAIDEYSTKEDTGIETDFETETFDADNFEQNSSAEEFFSFNPEDSFYYTELTEDIRERITGKSYPDTEDPLQIAYEDLAYVHVLHYDFQAQVQEGELICNQFIAQDLVDIFYELYESRYPIEKIQLIDEYDADDEASMADNNTSCFNYRTVPGRTKLSNHAYGYAIDVNPLYNPYVRTKDGETLISPDNAVPYADRSASFSYKIDKDDLCYRIFVEHGFEWGGSWNSSKDYQHFEKVP